ATPCEEQARIIGGYPTEITKHPYQVSLESNGNHSCGGSIISPDYVVTAAHCVVEETSIPIMIDPSELQVRAGSSYREQGGSVHQVLNITLHPEFRDELLLHNDIALIKVSTPFVYNDAVKPIPIATQSPSSGAVAVLTGWGVTREVTENLQDYLPSQLQEVKLVINSGLKCHFASKFFDNNMLCVTGVMLFTGACYGDSGGPLVSNGKLVGIVSGGIFHCALGFPEIYSNAAKFREWINVRPLSATAVVSTYPPCIVHVLSRVFYPSPARQITLNLQSGAEEGRVIGGNPTEITKHPYQISLERRGNHSCGGSIISPDYVVTAVHCVVQQLSPNKIDPSELQVRAGSSYREKGGSVHQISKTIIHPGFKVDAVLHNDIALIKVSTPFVYNDAVKPISIATVSPSVGAAAVLTGWGLTREVTDNPRDYLATQLQEVQLLITIGLRSTKIFAGACYGDSGGPLVSNGKLVGIVSGGIFRCGSGFPEVYSDAAKFREWVKTRLLDDDEYPNCQQVRRKKNPKHNEINKPTQNIPSINVYTPYDTLMDDTENAVNINPSQLTKPLPHKPPPIFIPGVVNVPELKNCTPGNPIHPQPTPQDTILSSFPFETRGPSESPRQASLPPMKTPAQIIADMVSYLHRIKLPILSLSLRYQHRIIGGNPTEITKHPYQISLERYANHSCGGSIISPDYVVTAGHCVVLKLPSPDKIDPSELQVRAGSSYREKDGSVHQVSNTILHPEFKMDSVLHNDIALIKVSTPFVYNDAVKPISIATESPSAGAAAVVTGWGVTREVTENPRDYLATQLQEVQLLITQGQRCDLATLQFDNNKLCVTAAKVFTGACYGDSGGPLVSNEKLVGIVSGGTFHCALGYPEVYTNAAMFGEWIKSETGIA
ncbi:hypothetical protein L9F63_007081, partial [Diploptera punctata]